MGWGWQGIHTSAAACCRLDPLDVCEHGRRLPQPDGALRSENADLRAALAAVCSVRTHLSPDAADAFRQAMRPHRAVIDSCRPARPTDPTGSEA